MRFVVALAERKVFCSFVIFFCKVLFGFVEDGAVCILAFRPSVSELSFLSCVFLVMSLLMGALI